MAEPAITQDEQRLKQRAMRRLAMALTLIAVAIVALALLDRYNASLKKTEPVLAPPPESPAPLAQPPVKQSSPPSPSSAAQPVTPPRPPPPVVENQQAPAPPPGHATPDYSAKKPAAQPGHGNPASPSETPAAPLPEQKSVPPAAASKPVAQAAAPTPSEPTASSKGFIVQVGVFMSAANARTLQNKLAEKGIPTHTETRVVVGPFKDRAEAEAVIRQLKELGVSGVVVAPPSPQ